MNEKTQEEILTRKANLARNRLLEVVDALDRKRHNLAHPMKLVARQLPQPASMVALGAGALVAIGAIGFVVAKVKARPPPRRKLFERPPPPPTFFGAVASRTLKALLVFALVEAGKLGIRRATNALPPPANPAAF